MQEVSTTVRKQAFVPYRPPLHSTDLQAPFKERKDEILSDLTAEVVAEMVLQTAGDPNPIVYKIETRATKMSLGVTVEVILRFQHAHPITRQDVFVRYERVGQVDGKELFSEPTNVTSSQAAASAWERQGEDVRVLHKSVIVPDQLFSGPRPKAKTWTDEYKQGKAAAWAEQPSSDCPYAPGGQRAIDWIAGHIRQNSIQRAYDLGKEANADGYTLSNNPYLSSEDILASYWTQGWQAAQMELVRKSLRGMDGDKGNFVWMLL